jgi:hypothetical protein
MYNAGGNYIIMLSGKTSLMILSYLLLLAVQLLVEATKHSASSSTLRVRFIFVGRRDSIFLSWKWHEIFAGFNCILSELISSKINECRRIFWEQLWHSK